MRTRDAIEKESTTARSEMHMLDLILEVLLDIRGKVQ